MTWLPAPYRVVSRTVETRDSVTLALRPVAESLPRFLPGQFAMLYAHGVGEVPISVSGVPGDGTLLHTVRVVGAVSRAGGSPHEKRPSGRPFFSPVSVGDPPMLFE